MPFFFLAGRFFFLKGNRAVFFDEHHIGVGFLHHAAGRVAARVHHRFNV